MATAPPRTASGRVCAVVVTYERRDLLRHCLQALHDERRAPDGILVVDNASADGTAQMVRAEFPGVELLVLPQNVGGAGGFHHGIARAHAQGYDWLWVLDDDTIASGDTLERLLAGAGRAPGGAPLLLCSLVRWQDETLHPMNHPTPRWRSRAQLVESLAHGLVLIRNATFVSVMVHRDAIDRFGLPIAEFFIWGDDIEYTGRVLRREPGYLVPDSVVRHWTPTPHRPGTPTSDRFYYHARNSLLLLRGDSMSAVERVDFARYYVRSIVEFVRINWRSPQRWRLLARALRDGMRDDARQYRPHSTETVARKG